MKEDLITQQNLKMIKNDHDKVSPKLANMEIIRDEQYVL